MGAWDIDPPGVQGVVNRTQGHATDLDNDITAISTAMEAGANGSASNLVAGAMSGFATHVAPDVKFVVHRTNTMMKAVVAATNAYVDGDLQMAANAQRSATAAPPADDMPGGGQGHTRGN